MVLNAVVERIQRTTVSDMTGLVIVVLAGAVILWRIRVRLIRRWSGHECPVCGGELRRRHRRWQDHLLSLLVPLARYRCRDADRCWKGLRVQGRR